VSISLKAVEDFCCVEGETWDGAFTAVIAKFACLAGGANAPTSETLAKRARKKNLII
jgi:hypothetical protein